MGNSVPISEFGPFAPMFPKGPYLVLMMPRGRLGVSALGIVRKAVEEPRWQTYAAGLLEGPNWRAHLGGATALLFEPNDEVAETLWSAFDGGSWVSPQLAVIAYFSDKEFPEWAKARIEARCSVKEPEIPDPIARHFHTGPAGTVGRRAKNLSSLMTICERIPQLGSWASEIRSQPDIQELLRHDEANDRADRLCLRYFKCITECFATAGWPLKPAYLKQSVG